MSFNRQRFWAVLSNWPITLSNKEYDYGFRLRELLKNKSETEDIFPGTPVGVKLTFSYVLIERNMDIKLYIQQQAENSRKLDSLMKLLNNCAKNEFPSKAIKGACGFELGELKKFVEDQISGKS